VRQQGSISFIGQVERIEGSISRIKIKTEFCEGLNKIDSFSHLIIIGWFHLKDSKKDRQTINVIPKRYPGAPEIGVFASRSPSRPNPIAISAVELLGIEGCTVLVKGLDFMEETPIVDIKPYLPRADKIIDVKTPAWTTKGPPS